MQFPRTGLVDVAHFGAWNAGLATGAVLCVATVSTWMVATYGSVPLWATASGLLLTVLSLACVLSERCHRPLQLQWNDGLWRVSFADDSHERSLGRVTVAIDLHVWMLLRCEIDGKALAGSVQWLVLQRAGLQGDWHSLRCALYAGKASESLHSGEALSPQ